LWSHSEDQILSLILGLWQSKRLKLKLVGGELQTTAKRIARIEPKISPEKRKPNVHETCLIGQAMIGAPF
jgi:hypothetical protein